MCRECCEYDQIKCVCPGQKEVVGYTIPCCRNEDNECDSCLIHPGELIYCAVLMCPPVLFYLLYLFNLHAVKMLVARWSMQPVLSARFWWLIVFFSSLEMDGCQYKCSLWWKLMHIVASFFLSLAIETHISGFYHGCLEALQKVKSPLASVLHGGYTSVSKV